MMEALNAVLMFLAVIVIIWVGAACQDKRSTDLIRRWVAQNGYELVEHKRSLFNRGPFFWTTWKGQTVYRVWVRTAEGPVREGWARCGSWWAGLMSDKVEVRWD